MSKAVVLLSGGLDSTTTLAIAKSQSFDCYALSFDYGQNLGVDYSQTISCYRANNKGEACGECDACVLRQNGFAKAGVVDPTNYQ